jgi:hypothetical protein
MRRGSSVAATTLFLSKERVKRLRGTPRSQRLRLLG